MDRRRLRDKTIRISVRSQCGVCMICVVIMVWPVIYGYCLPADQSVGQAGQPAQEQPGQETEEITWPEHSPAAAGAGAAEETVKPAGGKEKLEEIVSVSFKDMDLKQALSILAEQYDLNMLSGDEVKGAVTVNFKDVTVGDVLIQMLKLKNFTYKWEGNIIKVISAEDVTETRTFAVNYISLDLASEVIADKLSKDGKAKMNTNTNQLIITDTLARLEEMGKTLADIDVPPAQVRIESKLVDITHTDLDNLGITWTSTSLEWKIPQIKGGGHRLFKSEGSQKVKMTQADLTNAGTSSDLTGGQFKLGFSQAASSISATIDALIRDKKAKIIANPSITTVNNAEARINIGEKYPIKEQTQTSTGTLQTVRFVDIGTTLKVTPKINNNGTIQLTIHPEVSSVASTITDGPRITTREADTTVIVRDRETLIIAGLLQTTDNLNKSRVPILGDIPIVGNLFRSRDKKKEQKELVIFMTPYILNIADKEAYAARAKVPSETELTGERIGAVELFYKAEDLANGQTLQTGIFPVESRLTEAAKNYERISIIYPANYYADIGLFHAAGIYENRLKDYSAALSCYQKIVQDYPRSAYYRHAMKRMNKLIAKDLRKKK